MRRKITDKRLSDRALERVMQDVLKGMQAFSAEIAKPTQSEPTMSAQATAAKTQLFPRITSLCSADLFEFQGKREKIN